jgi:hypothetical protein
MQSRMHTWDRACSPEGETLWTVSSQTSPGWWTWLLAVLLSCDSGTCPYGRTETKKSETWAMLVSLTAKQETLVRYLCSYIVIANLYSWTKKQLKHTNAYLYSQKGKEKVGIKLSEILCCAQNESEHHNQFPDRHTYSVTRCSSRPIL